MDCDVLTLFKYLQLGTRVFKVFLLDERGKENTQSQMIKQLIVSVTIIFPCEQQGSLKRKVTLAEVNRIALGVFCLVFLVGFF